MNSPSSLLSPKLLQANQRLLELRQLAQKNREKSGQFVANQPRTDVPPWDDPETDELPASAVDLVPRLPPHLGWGSHTASQVIRRAARRYECAANEENSNPTSVKVNADSQFSFPLSRSTAENPPPLPLHKATVKHYPSIGIAALKKERAAIYRIWLLCRYLDPQGRGWLPVAELREKLNEKESEFRIFGWRRLRQVLGRGHGRFWTWDKGNGRIWLFGAARVAANLDVSRLSGKPVALPVKAVTKSIAEFKAHLYAAWHSGRKTNNPISRQGQKSISGVPERTQRHYCRVAKIGHRTNVAIGARYTQEEAEKQAWRHGRATFRFTDHKGSHGRKGNSYIAWQLPNSNSGPHQQSPKGRMRKINRKLMDLVQLGARGNGSEKVEKLYYANGSEAVRSLNRGSEGEVCWPLTAVSQRSYLWAVFSLA